MANRYLVTGADGFIGTHLLNRLALDGISTKAMLVEDHGQPLPANVQRVVADLADPDALHAATRGITHIVHLAARVHQMQDTDSDPLRAFREVNVKGTKNLLDAAEKNGVRNVLLMSSVKAMCERAADILDENSPCRPTTPYGISKLEAEHLATSWGERTHSRCVVFRLPMVYGPGAKGNALSLLAKAVARKRMPFAGIANKRSMVYVGNVADAVVRIMEGPQASGVFIVCDSHPYSTNDFYYAMGRAAGMKNPTFGVPVSWLRLMGYAGSLAGIALQRPMPLTSETVARLTENLCFSPTKLQRALGSELPYSLNEGMEEMVKWYRERDCSTRT